MSMNTVFVKGDVLMIYTDPVHQKNPEGLAQLVSHVEGENVNGLEMWWVEFKDYPNHHYKRFVSRQTRPTRAAEVFLASAPVEV